MDVFHKVLLDIYEITGDRENMDVDFVELLKREGFFPSMESIKGHLNTEGWIADSPRPDHIRITHWGMAEAKRALADPNSIGQGLDRHTSRLLSAARDLSIVIGEFVAKPDAKTLKPAEERLSEINDLISKIKKQL